MSFADWLRYPQPGETSRTLEYEQKHCPATVARTRAHVEYMMQTVPGLLHDPLVPHETRPPSGSPGIRTGGKPWRGPVGKMRGSQAILAGVGRCVRASYAVCRFVQQSRAWPP